MNEWWVSSDDEEFFGDYSHVYAATHADDTVDWSRTIDRDAYEMDAPVTLVARRMVEVERVEITWPPMTRCDRCGGDGCDDDHLDGCGLSGGNGWRHPLPVIESTITNRIKQTLDMIDLATGPTKWRDHPDAEALARQQTRLAKLRELHAQVLDRIATTCNKPDAP